MYKVFVDHRPIVLIEKDKFSGTDKNIPFDELKKFVKDIKRYLKETTVDQPLYVLCDDVDKDFNSLFDSYKKIRAAGGIVKRKNKFLVIKRNGKWDIPKGKIDKGEDKKSAAVREIEEECGIEGPEIRDFLVTTYHVFKHKGKKAIKKTFWYNLSYDGPKELTPQTKEGITKARWMTEEEMLAIRGRTYGSINEVLDAYLRSK